MSKRRFHEGSGPSQRQLRVGELIRRALADILARGDSPDPDLASRMITVTEARTAPDLRQATVYVMPLGGHGAEEALEALNRNRAQLRKEVTRVVQLKRSPELSFELDDTFDRIEKTNALLSDAKVRRDIEGQDAG
jgi:ribosome-binding factor A